MNITVYCGSSLGNKKIYSDSAFNLARWIVKKGHKLIYGGGKAGLMGIVSNTVIENGGEVIGIIPHFLLDRELGNENITQLIKVENMSQRKNMMVKLGDAYIALPGGAGTLEEISEVISWSRVGQNANPCIFFNVDNYYDSLIRVYDQMVESGFLSKKDRDKILFSDSIDEIENFIINYNLF